MKALIEEEGNNDLKLRVFVTGGGCSGLQYGFTFDEVANEDDTVMQKNGVSLLIDPMSYQYLIGAEIDYTEGLEDELADAGEDGGVVAVGEPREDGPCFVSFPATRISSNGRPPTYCSRRSA